MPCAAVDQSACLAWICAPSSGLLPKRSARAASNTESWPAMKSPDSGFIMPSTISKAFRCPRVRQCGSRKTPASRAAFPIACTGTRPTVSDRQPTIGPTNVWIRLATVVVSAACLAIVAVSWPQSSMSA